MAALAATRAPTLGGIADITAGAVAATVSGDTAPVGERMLLLAINAGGSSRTVTIATPGTVTGTRWRTPRSSWLPGRPAASR
ncbi:hypothetical protein SMICM304S_06790 [Streptomyces microflavus]